MAGHIASVKVGKVPGNHEIYRRRLAGSQLDFSADSTHELFAQINRSALLGFLCAFGSGGEIILRAAKQRQSHCPVITLFFEFAAERFAVGEYNFINADIAPA